MQFLSSSAMAREIPAALSAKATGLSLASRKPFTREREACCAPRAPATAGPWQRDKEKRLGGFPDPTFPGDPFLPGARRAILLQLRRVQGRRGALLAARPIPPATARFPPSAPSSPTQPREGGRAGWRGLGRSGRRSRLRGRLGLQT